MISIVLSLQISLGNITILRILCLLIINTGYLYIYLGLHNFFQRYFVLFAMRCQNSWTSFVKFISLWLFYYFDAFVNVFLHFMLRFSLLVDRNTIDFCLLILYPAILLSLLALNSFFFWIKIFYNVMSCHLQMEIILLFLSVRMLFISFSCLTALARTSSIVPNRSEQSPFSYTAFKIFFLSFAFSIFTVIANSLFLFKSVESLQRIFNAVILLHSRIFIWIVFIESIS